MAFKGFYYNALQINNDWDRKYNADDYSNMLRFVIGNGIVHFNNGTNLQVLNDDNSTVKQLGSSAATYGIKILTGYGWINGKAFENPTEFTGNISIIDNTGNTDEITLLTIPMVTKGYKRIDRVIVRRDDSPSVRETLPYILKGVQTAENTPIGQDINYAGNINGDGTDLCIAEVFVDWTGDVPVVRIYDKRADQTLCGWVNCYFGDNYEEYCATINEVVSSFIDGKTTEFNNWFQNARDNVATVTMTKEISKSYLVAASGTTFPIDIAEYDPNIDVLSVYTNGIYEVASDYTINADKTITFNTTKQTGAVIDFVVKKAIDAKYYDNPDETMIASVESRFTDIYEKLATSEELFNEATYLCSGVDDNIKISNLVKTFMAANTTDSARLRLNVRGKFGVTTPYQAYLNADSLDNYARWFDFSTTSNSNRRVLIDFANCSPINIPLTNNTSNIIFYGANQEIECCVLKAGKVADVGTKILAIFGRGDVHHKECKYSFICDSSCDFTRHGKFDNCEVTIMSKSANATAFYTDPTGCICEVDRGIYFLYVGKDVDSSTYGTKLVYYNRGKSYSSDVVDYSQATILRDVFVPSYTNSTLNGVSYYLVEGVYFKQDGIIFKSLTNGGGYIRANNIITASGRMANDELDASTDYIAEGTIPRSRALGQTPFV